MKVSVTTYSFSQLKRDGIADEKQMIRIARDIGFDGIEVCSLLGKEDPEKYAEEFKKEADFIGMPIVSYTVNANLLAPDLNAEIQRLKREVRIAHILGVPCMRHDAYFAFPENGVQDFEYYFESIVNSFGIIADYANEFNIKTCTENHGLICQDSERIERIIKAVNRKYFGWLLDIGNFLCVDENSLDAVKRGSSYAFHVHLKDFFRFDNGENCIKTRNGNFIQGAPLGEGVVPVKESVEVIDKTGYNGYYTVEYEGLEDCIPALQRSLKFAKSLL